MFNHLALVRKRGNENFKQGEIIQQCMFEI